nr:MAG TPA: hypothetical protein [Caudoviricetes sp.]
MHPWIVLFFVHLNVWISRTLVHHDALGPYVMRVFILSN